MLRTGLGNPNVNLHVQLPNTGCRLVRVRSLVLELSPDGGPKFSLPAQTYSRADGTPGRFLFTPFGLEPDKEWTNFVGFFAPFSMNDERASRYKIGAGVYFTDSEQTEAYPRIKDLN
jgi:hypothetical protein